MLDVHTSQPVPHALRDPILGSADWHSRGGRTTTLVPGTHGGSRTYGAGPASTASFAAASAAADQAPDLMAYRDGSTAHAYNGSWASTLPQPASYHASYSANDSLQQASYAASAGSNAHATKTPESQHSYATQSETSSQTKTIPTLLIPDTLQVPQSDLSQLASEVACLFWFEPGTIIDILERQRSSTSPMAMLSPGSTSAHIAPSDAFRKWLTSLLQTTQVTQNVIILALLFIYRLKKNNPGVVANPGSEFRLMTVALMLGNKFLDDNTYTNKTWADVSGISVHEIHTMEVEFLSNMRYSLFTTKAQWDVWHDKLSKFGRAVHQLIKNQEEAAKLAFAAPLPSPKKHQSPPFMFHHNGVAMVGHDNSHRSARPASLVPSHAISPIGPLPEVSYNVNRKRLRDDDVQEAPAKRRMPDTSLANMLPMVTMPPTAGQMHMARTHLPTTHLPSLTIPAQSNHLPPMHGLPAANERAMAMVYPQAHQRPMAQMMVTPIQSSNNTTPSFNALDHSRQLSPYPLSAASSPISANPHASHLSPSYFLSQRSSPYRPVRQVKTLLNPPRVPTSIYGAPRQVSLDHLQYHSLGQPLTERHVGHVPYFQREAWPQSYQPRQWPAQLGIQGSYVHQQHQ